MNLKDMRKGIFYITYAMILFFLLYNFHPIITMGVKFIAIILPFIVGGALAFILSLPMGFFEKKMMQMDKKGLLAKWKRPISLVLTVCIFIGIFVVVVWLIIPVIQDTTEIIISTVPDFLMGVIDSLKAYNVPADELEQWLSETAFNWSAIGQKILVVVKDWSTGLVTSTYGVVSSVIGVFADLFISLVFALYILFSKEKLAVQLKMICYAFLPENVADKAFAIGSLTHRTFASFFAGQCLEACILGMMFVVVMAVLRIPYAVLISVLIAITSLVPIFGAFIGCGIGVFLILMVDPMKALLFLIVFLVVQQIEGNLIYPKVVGGSVGLPAIWVLLAVSVGASLMGVVGMILFIPLFSVGYILLKEKTLKVLKENSVPEEKYQDSSQEF